MQAPKYAQGTPLAHRIKFFCKGACGKVRYGKLSKIPYPTHGANTDMEMYVTCLFCGHKQRDTYNWLGHA
jgi:hypothetical protein